MKVILIDGGPASACLLDAPARGLRTARWRASRELPALGGDERVRVIADWDRFRADLLAETRDVDLLVCPPNAHAAAAHGEVDANMRAFSHTMTWNLAGWPGAVVRAGHVARRPADRRAVDRAALARRRGARRGGPSRARVRRLAAGSRRSPA